jgi:hypothetical protein
MFTATAEVLAFLYHSFREVRPGQGHNGRCKYAKRRLWEKCSPNEPGQKGTHANKK